MDCNVINVAKHEHCTFGYVNLDYTMKTTCNVKVLNKGLPITINFIFNSIVVYCVWFCNNSKYKCCINLDEQSNSNNKGIQIINPTIFKELSY